jgi:dipeptidase E
VSGRILACGGSADVVRFLLGLSSTPRPRVCYLATASGDDAAHIVAFYEWFTPLPCEPYHVTLFGAPDRPAERVAAADVVWVGGGNTANLLAIWRVHGVDLALREAWQGGAVLAGASAGANCWFEGSVTDSFGLGLAPLTDGLGLLAGSFCPHYDSEERRRPVYLDLVANGALPPGLACDDEAAALFEGTDLAEIVASSEDARAFRVTPDGEEPLDTRVV